jgi:hypothetical protein
MTTTKKGIFISHIHEEAKLGAVVKDWAVDAFPGGAATAFLSSDDQDLPAGRKWLEVIEKQVADAGVMISLLSPASIVRPWVNIELGAAWINHVPVIPLCHSGLDIAKLPRPFGDFNAVALDQNNAAMRLIGGIADALQLAHSKKLHFEDCLKEMRAAATKSKAELHATPANKGSPTSEPPGEQVTILQCLARAENAGIKGGIEEDGAIRVSMLAPAVFKYHAAELENARLIYVSRNMYGTHYEITPDGSGWLIKNKLMPG